MRAEPKRRKHWITQALPSTRTLARGLKAYLRAPWKVQLGFGVATIVMVWLTVNWVIQVVRKPTELFFPVSTTLNKSPRETWAQYGRDFRTHSTAVISPELLAALAQAEGAGNPVARTYWRWAFSTSPFEIYKPASSAVGMYQITDGTFDVARHYCVHDHKVVEDGPWYAWHSCWFTWLYSRVIPRHAIEMTSAHLDRQVARVLADVKTVNATIHQKQDLAVVIHLCGARAGEAYAKRGMRLVPHQRCGDTNAASYVARVDALKEAFAKLRASE